MGFKFREPLVIKQGTGVTVVPDNTELFGLVSPSQLITLSIDQAVETTSNLIFNQTTISDKFIIDNSSLIFENGIISGSLTFVGGLTAIQNFTTNGDMAVQGNTVTAEKIETQLSQSYTLFESGSSIFGDSIDDTHQFSGSVLISGSLALSSKIRKLAAINYEKNKK